MSFRRYILMTVMMLLATASRAQDVFDLMGYVIPQGGWSKKTGENFVSLTFQDASGRAIIGLYRSTPTSGTSEADAKIDWDEIVLKRYPDVLLLKVENNPIPKSEWNSILQFGLVTKDEMDIGVTTVTITGYGRHLSVSFESTHKDLDHFLPEFLAQMTLYQPPRDTMAATVQESLPAKRDSIVASASDETTPASVVGKWTRTTKTFSNAFTGYKSATQGDAHYYYTFSDDNTYDFHSEQWSEPMKCMFVHSEQGSFKLDDAVLKLYPARSVIEKHGYKDGKAVTGGPLLQSKNLSLTPTRYTWSIKREGETGWSLVLQTEKQTDRDGAFSTVDTLQNAYHYSIDK